jgi:hypothetical protein
VAWIALGLKGAAAEGINEAAFDRCRAIPEAAARLRCFESITSDKPKAPTVRAGIGMWRLVRTYRR